MTARTAAKRAAAPKPEPEPVQAQPQPLTRAAAVALLKEKGYAGPVSYDMGTLRGIVEWVAAGSPKDGPVPVGALHAVHPDLKPQPKSGNGEVRAVVRDLRRAASAVLVAEDPTAALNDVDGLAARLRELAGAC